MEAYILDALYRRIQVVDQFESLIWTERYAAIGDFQMDIHSNSNFRRILKAGAKLAINDSYRVMEVETIEDKDENGEKLLVVKGRSMEKILEDRVARPSKANLTTTPRWTITGLPADIARKLFHDICVLGVLDPTDVIPGVTEASIFPEDTIPEPSTTITVEIETDTLYKVLGQLCDMYDLGFRLVRDPNNNQFYFDVYTGSDRTTSQTTLEPVIFSPDLDNLQNPTELTSIAAAKNVAYVISPVGFEIVYPEEVDPAAVTGLERRVLFVKADDVTDTDAAAATAKMIQRGKEELAKWRSFSAFDGEINQNSQYKYGRNYNLGDLVEQRNSDGVTNVMRITEQIFVSDKEGERSYPTLTINKFITPGSWAAWNYNQEWVDLEPDPTAWADA